MTISTIRPPRVPLATLFFTTVFLLTASSFAKAQTTIFLDGQGHGRTFEGICGVNGGGATGRLLINYPEPQRSQILDYLFKPHFGASFQAYKAEIGGDGNSTEGAEPSHMHTRSDSDFHRGYQWWTMKEAKKRNPAIKLMALAWDFPAWINDVNSAEATDYIVSYIRGAKSVQGLDIDYVGLWNETKAHNESFIRLRRALDAAGFHNTKIIADDQVRTWAIADSMRADKALYDAIGIVSTHYPKYESFGAKEIGKPVWSSEDGPWSDSWGASGQQSGPLAKLLNLNYIDGRMTSTHIWNIISSYYDILDLPYAGAIRAATPWSGQYKVMSPVWVIAHTTQFASPGWHYIDNACGQLPLGGSFVTLKDRSDYSVVIETLDALKDQILTFRVRGGLSHGDVFVWRTDSARAFEKIAVLHPVNGSFSLAVSKSSVYSLTTTTGQHKGTVPPSLCAKRAFPFPYREDFEKYPAGTTCVNYFIEQNGAYEVTNATHGRKGKVLRQVVSSKPVEWGSGATDHLLGTASIIGDKNWSNYTVSADILLEERGYARVMGRVSRVTLDGQINGYQLYLYDSGLWKLAYATTGPALDSGHVECGLDTWHHLSLSFNKDTITVLIDSKEKTCVRDDKFSKGMAGIGNDYNKGMYDNFSIAPVRHSVPLFTTAAVVNNYFLQRPPETPSMRTSVALSNAARLSWDPVPGAKGYTIRFGNIEGKYDGKADVGDLHTYTLWTLEIGKKYFFTVSAYNDKGESAPSAPENAIIR